MALDDDAVLLVLVQPLRLAAEDALRVGADDRAVGVEENAVADIDGEILGGARRRRTSAQAQIGGGVRGLLVGAARDRERQEQRYDERIPCQGCDAAHAGLSFAFE
jgi:hypothetical protein